MTTRSALDGGDAAIRSGPAMPAVSRACACALVLLAAAAPLHTLAQTRDRSAEFAPKRLVDPPLDRWLTNGGNLTDAQIRAVAGHVLTLANP